MCIGESMQHSKTLSCQASLKSANCPSHPFHRQSTPLYRCFVNPPPIKVGFFSDFSRPFKNVTHLFPSNWSLKVEVLSIPPFLKLWLELQPAPPTPPPPSRKRGGRVVDIYEFFPDWINRNHLDLILVSHGRNYYTMENLRKLHCCKWKSLMKPCEIAKKGFYRKYKPHQKHKFIYCFLPNFQLS